MERNSEGYRVAQLLSTARDDVLIVAPFVKKAALRALIEQIPKSVSVTCVTRWKPREIAAGVSDPQAFDVLERRGNSSLFLVDRLHAKIYVADGACLVGSANVTDAALGFVTALGNIEVLVEAPRTDPSVASALSEIDAEKRAANAQMARAAVAMAEQLRLEGHAELEPVQAWFPVSRQPQSAHALYSGTVTGYLGDSERQVLSDLARANVQPGLSEQEFRKAIRQLLAEHPLAPQLLAQDKDTVLTQEGARITLEKMASEDWGPEDLWRSFVSWMAFFFDDTIIKQEIVEVSLRRAQRL